MALIDNLAYYAKLDGNSNDSVGSNNGTDTVITYSAGNGIITQGAGLASASSSKILLPNNSLVPTGNFSVQAWIKNSTGVLATIFQGYNQQGVASGWQLRVLDSNVASLFSGKNTGFTDGVDVKSINGATDVCTGAWFHIVGVWDGTYLRLYVNGTSDATAVSWANAPAYNATTYVSIGVNRYGSGDYTQYFNGAIDEIGFWTKALSTDEITALYNGGVGLQYPFQSLPANNLKFYRRERIPGLITGA